MQVQGETSINKLILLFVFDKMEGALSERTVVEMCTVTNTWLNYMDCVELIPRLIDDGFLYKTSSSEEEPLYTLKHFKHCLIDIATDSDFFLFS